MIQNTRSTCKNEYTGINKEGVQSVSRASKAMKRKRRKSQYGIVYGENVSETKKTKKKKTQQQE
jgi:hypothetical protein